MAQTQDGDAVRGDGTRDAVAGVAAPAPQTTTPAEAAPRTRAAARKDPPTLRPAADSPVARVAVDIPLAHLDRPFDYLVPERLAAPARPGVRVRVRFAGQLTDGFVLDRVAASEHQGRLAWLDRVISPEVVLTQEIAGLARAVADRYAGTLADVLRLAVPPRHAATENTATGNTATENTAAGGAAVDEAGGRDPARGRWPGGAHAAVPADGPPASPGPGPWARYPAGEAFLRALAAGRPARAAWTALPGQEWPEEIALAAATTAAAGRGALIVVPDARDLARVDQALARALGRAGPESRAAPGAPRHVTLSADLGPAERYRRWLAVLRGQATVAAGTRAAMFAPVRDLGLVVLWDEGDDLHAEPHAPYPNAREVLALRAHRARAAALIGGFARTPELAQLVASGWARSLEPERATVRATAPRVMAAADEAELRRDAGATTSRLPSLALRTVRAALSGEPGPRAEGGKRPPGPVLVQVPRRGYLAAIACGRCRAKARCARCGGPLQVTAAQEVPSCGWCGALAGGWRCGECGHDKVRAIVIGAARTAEELGRAFPGIKIRTSGSGSAVLPAVPDEPALVIATPGAEPVARYAAALLLDGWALLARPSLRSDEEALRRWMAAAALVRPDGTVLIHADAALPVTQALIRWDPVTFAERTLAERADLRFPPAVRMAAVTGAAAAVASLLAAIPEPSHGHRLDVLGPVPVPLHLPGEANFASPGRGSERGPGEAGSPLLPGVDRGLPPGGSRESPPEGEQQVRALLRAPRADSLVLARALHAAQAARSARKEGGGARVQLDPAELI
jgi:primosomal protein N' (replication factor Y)